MKITDSLKVTHCKKEWMYYYPSYLYLMRRNIVGDRWHENFANVSKNAQILVMLEPHLYPIIWIAVEVHRYLFRFWKCDFIVYERAFCKLSHIQSFPEMHIRYEVRKEPLCRDYNLQSVLPSLCIQLLATGVLFGSKNTKIKLPPPPPS